MATSQPIFKLGYPDFPRQQIQIIPTDDDNDDNDNDDNDNNYNNDDDDGDERPKWP